MSARLGGSPFPAQNDPFPSDLSDLSDQNAQNDQVVPVGITALVSAKLIKNAVLKVYPGYPHGMPQTHKDVINADLLAFVQGKELAATTTA